jgi:CheY-like chemotaxis protein
MRKAKTQAEAANAAKDHFLAMLSHELRTPLTPVLMCLSDRVNDPALADDLRADLAMICRNVKLEARLIDDLLDLTRIARSKIELHTEVVDAHEVLREALEVCSANDAVRRHLTISCETLADRHHVHADRARLQQVYWNLINNAIKFTPDEGRVTIRSYNTPEGKLAVEVRDTGIGIEPEKIEQLFAAFEQGERTITRRFGGLGLGLAISKALVELHGGQIRAESEGRGMGAVFTTELEVCEAPPTPSADLSAREAAPASLLRILLVEDHAPTLNVISRLLRRVGHTVSTASRVEEARALLAQQTFDLLVSDLGLPDGTGIDLVRELSGRNLPSIALSGYGMDADIRECLAAGFHSHLTKPIDWRQLETAIQQITSATRK